MAAGKAVAAGKLRVTWLDADTQPAFCAFHFPRTAAASAAAPTEAGVAAGAAEPGSIDTDAASDGGDGSASGAAHAAGYASPCADGWWREAGEKLLRRSRHRPVYLLAYKPVGGCGKVCEGTSWHS